MDQGESPETTAAVRGYVRSLFDRASARRLEAAWAELDAQREAEWGEGVTDEGKTYACKHCGKTFTDRHALAGHVSNTHSRRRLKRTRQRGKGAPKAEIPCPTCGQTLPAAAGWVAGEFEKEGLDEEQAARLAAKAWGLLVVQ